MFSISDLARIILKLEMALNIVTANIQLGREIMGCWTKNMLSAYAAYLCSVAPVLIRWMLRLFRIVERKGSNESANMRGERTALTSAIV